MDLLLDTHVVLWSLYQPSRIPHLLRSAIEASDTRLFISMVSLWEMLDKAAKGRLPLAGAAVDKILQRIDSLRPEFLPLSVEDIQHSVNLPPHHGDPFDRMLIAQAISRRLILATKDAEMAKYGVSIVWD